MDLAWSPDSMFLMSGSVDNQCMIWDISTGTLLDYHIFRVDYLNALRLLKSHQRDDQQLVCCRQLWCGGISCQITLTLCAVNFYLERCRVCVVECPKNGSWKRVVSPCIPVYIFYLVSSITLMRAALSTGYGYTLLQKTCNYLSRFGIL